MDLHVWLGFVATSLVLLVIPGPTILLVVSYALGQGMRAAFPMAVGVALGFLAPGFPQALNRLKSKPVMVSKTLAERKDEKREN